MNWVRMNSGVSVASVRNWGARSCTLYGLWPATNAVIVKIKEAGQKSGLSEFLCEPRSGAGARSSGLPRGGLAWGELCPECRAERNRRANRLARRISLPATLLVGLYVILRLPPLPVARFYGLLAVLTTFIVVRKVVQRVALELLPR